MVTSSTPKNALREVCAAALARAPLRSTLVGGYRRMPPLRAGVRMTRWRPHHLLRCQRVLWAAIAMIVVLIVALASGAVLTWSANPPWAAAAPALPRRSAPIEAAPSVHGQPPVTGPLRAPGGPFLRDALGRVALLRGVNVVYKRAPYEVYPDPGKPWNFDAHDASLMARLGFDVVRLGMTWKGLEPGKAPANDPAICRRGRPGDPHQYNSAVLYRYLARLKETVDLLARFHIFTILDMHQDVYNEMFDGEGAPNWAVCTDGLPNVDPPGRWSSEYGTAAAGAAFRNFWTNDVVGNLQGQFDFVWGKVARYFSKDPWVIGFDPFNEPFSSSLVRYGGEHFDAQLQCFYTGKAHTGPLLHGAPPIRCPRAVPENGVVPRLLANDPNALVFDEPDIFADRGLPTFLGPMPFPHLVFNFHVYCSARNPQTGNPTDVAACAAQELRALVRRRQDRREMASSYQRGGPAWFMSEFGATSDPALLSPLTAIADRDFLGWTYWSWRYYADPTGSAAEALVMADGRLRSTARVLSRVYPEAIAGTPLSMRFDPTTGAFSLAYRPDRAIAAPTVIQVPVQVHYPSGYCAAVRGGRIVSRRTARLLLVRPSSARTVHVSIRAGRCR